MTLDGVRLNGGALLTNSMYTGQISGFYISVDTYIPDAGSHPEDYRTRLLVRYSEDPTFASSTWLYGVWRPAGFSCVGCTDVTKTIGTMDPNTKYYVRVYMDYEGAGMYDLHNGSWYTNLNPLAPTLVAPVDNTSFDGIADVPFDWTFNDPDSVLGAPHSVQRGYELRYRTVATPLAPSGEWVTVAATTASTNVNISSSIMASNTQYEWQVRTQDYRSQWGPWSELRVYYVGGTTSTPTLLSPIDNVAIVAEDAYTFEWQFRSPNQAATQAQADLRYREIGAALWTTLTGAGGTPGTNEFWSIAGSTFTPASHYEWQVRTTDNLAAVSAWSPSSFFWSVAVGQDSGEAPPPELSENQPRLGVGQNEVYIYDRGGKRQRGQVKPLARLQWSRKRDDISNALLTTNGFGDELCSQLLGEIRTWRHEVVIFRDGVRVWEGPIVRISWGVNSVEIEAFDVMAYVYRRILRAGYNDAYRLVNGVQLGLKTVVVRARQIIMNALGYDDPNVLRYLTALQNVDDTTESRVVPAYSKSAFAEVDDLAATAGLDYTVVGRRIILVDTHRPTGNLPEMSDGDFSEPPIVTEYGMQAANQFAVTNNSGVYGMASRISVDEMTGEVYVPPEGYIEQVASAYGESTGAASSTVLTPAAKAQLEATLRKQAQRNIAPRWPVPVLVRVPDNSSLNPELNIGINQLVPGVYIPLRAVGTLRKVTQTQKLDSMRVQQEGDKAEIITVVMSPAPKPGEDEQPPEEV